MTAPETILVLNIRRYRTLVETEQNPERRAEIHALLDRDIAEHARLVCTGMRSKDYNAN